MQAGLGGLIRGAGAVRRAAGDAPDQHDVAARGTERREQRADEVVGAGEVDREEAIPVLRRELVQPPLRDVGAGGDDERVQRSLRGQPLREPGDGGAVADVERVRDHAPARRRLDRAGAPRGRVHVRAGLREGERGGEADPARRAGDERDAAVERAHALRPPGPRPRGRP